MYGRLLKLWHSLQAYGGRAAGGDEETLGRLV